MILGISGTNQSGKKTLYKCLCSILNQNIDKVDLKDLCKLDLNKFLVENVGISAYTTEPDKKVVINDLIQTYYNLKNKQSNNLYWVSLIKEQVSRFINNGLLIVNDISNENEVNWLKQMGGELIYVSRISLNGRPIVDKNDLQRLADYNLTWQTSNDINVLIDTVSIQLHPILDKILGSPESTVEGSLEAFKHILDVEKSYNKTTRVFSPYEKEQ